MDSFLAPWKMCLQCLPFFSSEPLPPAAPPPPSTVLPLHATTASNGASALAKNSSEDGFHDVEKPSFSDSSLAHDHQHQDLPLSDYAKEVGSLAADAGGQKVKCDAKHADHDSNQVVFANTGQSPHDVEFAISGSITPTPVGLGHIVGQQKPLHHIHDQVSSQHNKGHSVFHSHGHDKASLHPVSDSIPNDGHPEPPLLSSQSDGDGGTAEAHHQHSHKQNDDMMDPVHGHHMSMLPLETSHSTPADIDLASGPHGLYNDEDTSSALETSQTELVGTARVRRRDQLKHQFKDLRNQFKQGGHHLKEEGSKHLQNMMSSMNKQAQQIEESGTFFMVPRNHMS